MPMRVNRSKMWTLVSATVVFIADHPTRGVNSSVAGRGLDGRIPNSDSADRPGIGDHWTMTDDSPPTVPRRS